MSKTAIITGAGTGIGAGIAIAFAEAGYNLALAGRRVEPLEEIARECGLWTISRFVLPMLPTGRGFRCLSTRRSRLLVASDILVNNAGINSKKTPLDRYFG